MAVEVERLLIRIEATQNKLEKEMKKATGTVDRQARRIERRFDGMNRRLGQSFAGIGRSLAGAFAGVFTAREVKNLSDAATRIDNALKVAGVSANDLENVYGRLRDAAMANAAPIESLVELYSRASLVQKELNVSSKDLLGFTDSIAVALRVSGKSAEESSGALLQLSQALGSGVVRAEEFNSILEGALPIAQAAAAGLEEAGGSVAKLRQLVVDGKVSSEAFFRAFEAGSVTLRDRVQNAELTISQAFGNLRTALIDTAREFNKATNASGNFARGIDTAARAISDFDVSTFISKMADAQGAFQRFMSSIGDAEIFRDLNDMLGISDADGNMINLDAEAAKREAAGLEKEVELLQATIAKNTELGFDTSEAIGRLDQVRQRLAVVRAELAGMPATMPDPLKEANDGKARDAAIMASEKARRDALGGGVVKQVSLNDFAAPAKRGGGSSGGGSSAANRADDYERLVKRINEAIEATNAETAAQASLNPLIDDYGYAVEKARVQQDLLNAAKEQGLAVTPGLRNEIDKLAHNYAMATVEAAKLAETQDEIRAEAEDLANFNKDLARGIIDGFTEGADAADIFADALKKVGDRLINDVLDGIFQVKNAAGGGGGLFGFLGSLFGGGGSPLASSFIAGGGVSLFAKGGVWAHGRDVSLPKFARGGISKSAAIFGEAGPEAAVPLPDGRRIPVDLRMPSTKASAAAPSREVAININLAGARGDAEIRRMVVASVHEGISEFSRTELPLRVNEISEDPRAVG